MEREKRHLGISVSLRSFLFPFRFYLRSIFRATLVWHKICRLSSLSSICFFPLHLFLDPIVSFCTQSRRSFLWTHSFFLSSNENRWAFTKSRLFAKIFRTPLFLTGFALGQIRRLKREYSVHYRSDLSSMTHRFQANHFAWRIRRSYESPIEATRRGIEWIVESQG